MNRILAASAAVAAATLTANAGITYQTVTVDFDDQIGGFNPSAVTDGLFSPYVTFSTETDHTLLIFSGSGFIGGSDPNALTAAESVGASNFDSDIYMDFTDEFGLSIDNLVFDAPVPTPGALALFAIAGLTITRRQR